MRGLAGPQGGRMSRAGVVPQPGQRRPVGIGGRADLSDGLGSSGKMVEHVAQPDQFFPVHRVDLVGQRVDRVGEFAEGHESFTPLVSRSF